MITFQIQNSDGTFSPVSHNKFFEILNGGYSYLYYKQGGTHLAMLPTAENEETIRICRQEDNSESAVTSLENRCRDEKGRPCRYQHDCNGRVIRNSKGLPVYAKCGDCPRDGWSGGRRENCCIRNYCKTVNCIYCRNPRECHTPHSLDWLTENKRDDLDNKSGGFFIADINSDTQADIERDELELALHTAIEKLPPPERAVIKAIYWGGISQRVYATENGMDRCRVNRLYLHALKALKNLLKDFQ